jgi:hypothetical protein
MVLCLMAPAPPSRAQALPFLPAGDTRLRHEVELNQDEDRVPLSTTWPIPTLDIPEDHRNEVRSELQPGSAQDAGWFIDGGYNPTRLRVYEDTPRQKGEAGVQSGWAAGDYAGGVLRMSYAVDPQDQMHWILDDSYASWRFGNWWVTLGMQERWWGPGWDGSLILSNNARPMPGIALDRASSKRPDWKWLRWVGPWRLTTMMDAMETRRPDFDHVLFWGFRFTFQPINGLEIGLSRTALWCGSGRPCNLSTFWSLINTRSSAKINESGPNPNINDKPGMQQGAIDIRWHLPETPFALYWQEYGQTFDSGNFRPRLTLQLFGLEMASRHMADGRTRVFLEFADTTCSGVSFSSSDQPVYGCAYENPLYTAGYRFRDRAIGDAMDRDGRRFTFGVLYIDEGERMWQIRLRKLEINRGGEVSPGSVPHTVSTVPEDLYTFEPIVDGTLGGFKYQIGGGVDRVTIVNTSGHSIKGHAFLNLTHSW